MNDRSKTRSSSFPSRPADVPMLGKTSLWATWRPKTGAAAGSSALWWGMLIALFFGFWGLRSIGANNIVDTDGARHAMNGAFLHDFVARGKLTGIVQYA